MAELKPLICKRCGGALDPVTLKCPYCGTYHKIDSDDGFVREVRYIVDRPEIKVLKGAVRFDPWELARVPEEGLMRMANDEICHGLAEALKPYIEYYSERDVPTGQTVVMGRVRVVEPSYRF